MYKHNDLTEYEWHCTNNEEVDTKKPFFTPSKIINDYYLINIHNNHLSGRFCSLYTMLQHTQI